MSDTPFRKGETVILYSGGQTRNSIELAQIAEDSSYVQDTVLIRFGNFNTSVSKSSVHKAPTSLKRQLKDNK